MSRNKQKIEKAVKAKGYPLVNATWEPIGGNVEMVGREGGWTVEVDDHDYVFGYSTEEVLENIAKLPQWEPMD